MTPWVFLSCLTTWYVMAEGRCCVEVVVFDDCCALDVVVFVAVVVIVVVFVGEASSQELGIASSIVKVKSF